MKDREAWHAAVHGVTRVGHDLVTEQQHIHPVSVIVSSNKSGNLDITKVAFIIHYSVFLL